MISVENLKDMSSFQTLLFICLCQNFLLRESAFALLLNDNNFAIRDCEVSSTLPGYGIVVTHSRPNDSDRGSVLIKTAVAAVNHTRVLLNPTCTWTYHIQDLKEGVVGMSGALNNGSSVKWNFQMTGLLKVFVVAYFDTEETQVTIKNCTYVNVTGDY